MVSRGRSCTRSPIARASHEPTSQRRCRVRRKTTKHHMHNSSQARAPMTWTPAPHQRTTRMMNTERPPAAARAMVRGRRPEISPRRLINPNAATALRATGTIAAKW